MARPLLGSYHHHHHLHGGTITISTEVIVMIPLEPPETPHRAKFQPLSALFQLCVSLLFNPWWWYHPKEQTRFLFCNRYDCIQKHWLIVYCKCFILKWWHFPIVCKYLWIWGSAGVCVEDFMSLWQNNPNCQSDHRAVRQRPSSYLRSDSYPI